MRSRKFRLYALLSELPRPRSYLGKILFTAFVGTHIPLLILIFYFVMISPLEVGMGLRIIVIALIATLVGAGITLYVLNDLTAPVSLVSRSLREYLDERKLPDLPVHYTDSVGRLMADVQYAVGHMDELIRLLEQDAVTDQLTGLYNRRYCEERLSQERANRNGQEITVAAFDIDDFKLMNDRYGHEFGDVCLKLVAGVVKNNVRKGDWVARWGGGEFMLVLYDVNERETAKVVGRLRKEVKAASPENVGLYGLGLTLSFGATLFNPEEDLQTLLAKADRALREAKQRGKNRLKFYAGSLYKD